MLENSRMPRRNDNYESVRGGTDDEVQAYVSLKKLSMRFDADPSSVRRWLREAGIEAIAFGNGPRSAIRYRTADVERWLATRPAVN